MQVIEAYRKIRTLSEEMLECARGERWSELLEVEKARAEVIEFIKNSLTGDEIHRTESIILIKQIQEYDAETTNLTQAWINELAVLLTSLDSSKKLQRAYKEQ